MPMCFLNHSCRLPGSVRGHDAAVGQLIYRSVPETHFVQKYGQAGEKAYL